MDRLFVLCSMYGEVNALFVLSLIDKRLPARIR